MVQARISFVRLGDRIELKRNLWGERRAFISDYPGLLDEVLKYTWTLKSGNHTYLWNAKLNMYLHKFVLAFLYGQNNVENMLANENIIEHLDNDGLNCIYDNLHIISSDYNKAKAFTIDKELSKHDTIPSYVTDAYYSHTKKLYQIQVLFNRNVFFEQRSGIPIASLFFQYCEFATLYIDWLYLLESRAKGEFRIETIHANRIFAEKRPIIVLREDEKDHVVIERNGHFYLHLNPDGGDKMAFLEKSAYKDLSQNKEE